MPPLPPPQSLNDVAPGNRVRIVCLPSHADLRERLQAMGILHLARAGCWSSCCAGTMPLKSR